MSFFGLDRQITMVVTIPIRRIVVHASNVEVKGIVM